MSKSDLELVSGGEYAPVAARISLFYERFAEGRIITELISRSEREVTFRALVYRTASERKPAATGWASEVPGDGDINTVACLENTETSAIGRALANLGFTASGQRPSLEEMAKAARARSRLGTTRALATRPGTVPGTGPAPAPEGDTAPDSPNHLSAVLDALDLLEVAESHGMDPDRVQRLRMRLIGGGLRLRAIERIERAVRGWLRDRHRLE